MEVLGVSACLLGLACRYDGKSKANKDIIDLQSKYILVPLCPEIYGGLPTPRPPAEIIGDKVINVHGQDVTYNYEAGARASLDICRINKIKKCVLKSKSPSCGKYQVYDGSFSGKLVEGQGLTCALLEEHGIQVYDEDEIHLL